MLKTLSFSFSSFMPYAGSILLHTTFLGLLISGVDCPVPRGADVSETPISMIWSAEPASHSSSLKSKSAEATLLSSKSGNDSGQDGTTAQRPAALFKPELQRGLLKKIPERRHRPKKKSPPNARPSKSVGGGHSKPTQRAPEIGRLAKQERGDASTSVASLSKPIYSPKPIYPHKARRKKWQGRVHVQVFVGPDGSVSKIALATSSSYESLDQAALKGVRQWRFPKSCVSCGERRYIIPVNFSLKDT